MAQVVQKHVGYGNGENCTLLNERALPGDVGNWPETTLPSSHSPFFHPYALSLPLPLILTLFLPSINSPDGTNADTHQKKQKDGEGMRYFFLFFSHPPQAQTESPRVGRVCVV